MLTDAILTIRCPYCIAGIDFRLMTAYKDGRFVCRDCAHTVHPGLLNCRCSCRKCLRLAKKSNWDVDLTNADVVEILLMN
jgi:hypothetical protein